MADVPERIWLTLNEINGHQRYVESSNFDATDIEYARVHGGGDATCEWTLVEQVNDEHPNLYRSECGIMLTRRQEWWKYCQLCGREIK